MSATETAAHTFTRTVSRRHGFPPHVTYTCTCTAAFGPDTGDEVRHMWFKHLRDVAPVVADADADVAS
jgi:hypothetical protein